jgi:hypothetical protein
MNLEESFFEKLGQLPPEKRSEALDFVDFLHSKSSAAVSLRRRPRGLWADLGIKISEQEISQARAECWSGFARGTITLGG